MIYYALPTLIVISILCFKLIEIAKDKKIHSLRNKQYEKEVMIMTVELKNIMSLNKMCIEKWEKSVLENAILNQTNYQLLQIIHKLENQE